MYPSVNDYINSVWETECFRSLRLSPVLDKEGEPYRIVGGLGVVFKMKDDNGQLFALKCFTAEQPERDRAYKHISDELQDEKSGYFASFRYIPDELYASDGKSDGFFPVLVMDWVEGLTLDKYISANLNDATVLNDLCCRFAKLATWLYEQPFAHGDLKPDNIMVQSDGSLILIDYDGMYVPAMAGETPREHGTQDYVHPQRSKQPFDAHIDDFTMALLMLSIKAIALNPNLYHPKSRTDKLLLGMDDYISPDTSNVLRTIALSLYDPVLQHCYGTFFVALANMRIEGNGSYWFDLPASHPQPQLQFRPQHIAAPQPAAPISTNIPKSLDRTFTVGGVDFKMIYVEGGTFTMGATIEQGEDAWYNETPAHQVTLSSYYIGETAVTQKLWTAVMGENPSNWNGGNLPVDSVSWYDCQKFIGLLNDRLSSKLGGGRFALPTEAQWEFAARGGNNSRHCRYAGSNSIDIVSWNRNNSENRTHPVKGKQPNELGLYDMSGNVWEWCFDWSDYYSSSPQINPAGRSNGSHRVSRGGSWSSDARGCRVSYRGYDEPESRNRNRGFRIALLMG